MTACGRLARARACSPRPRERRRQSRRRSKRSPTLCRLATSPRSPPSTTRSHAQGWARFAPDPNVGRLRERPVNLRPGGSSTTLCAPAIDTDVGCRCCRSAEATPDTRANQSGCSRRGRTAPSWRSRAPTYCSRRAASGHCCTCRRHLLQTATSRAPPTPTPRDSLSQRAVRRAARRVHEYVQTPNACSSLLPLPAHTTSFRGVGSSSAARRPPRTRVRRGRKSSARRQQPSSALHDGPLSLRARRLAGDPPQARAADDLLHAGPVHPTRCTSCARSGTGRAARRRLATDARRRKADNEWRIPRRAQRHPKAVPPPGNNSARPCCDAESVRRAAHRLGRRQAL